MSNCPKCNTELKLSKKDGVFYIYCPKCDQGGRGADPDEAWNDFLKNQNIQPESENTALLPTQVRLENFPDYVDQHKQALSTRLGGMFKKSAVENLLEVNTNYIMNDKNLEKLWNSEEGVQSLIDCFNEAVNMAAELPKLGYILPFGQQAVFIPRREAYENVLCNGKNAPFKWLNVEAVYQKDKKVIKTVNGEFMVEVEKASSNRGEIEGVAVYGYLKRREGVVGTYIDAQRLFEKGTDSSPAYRGYQRDLNDLNKARSEGRIKTDSDGKEYFEKQIPKKDGTSWNKKVYVDDIKNPYEGPHREEMLCKVAEKSYLQPFIKGRMGYAILEDMEQIDVVEVVDQTEKPNLAQQAIDMAETQFTEDIPDNEEEM